ncbi:MAG TPA: GPP34 family phosphoprotein [Streptosporangiaceae bacterium]|nr:GPP34 family phosphoprotein [Streptosporangiaceae bacterium]
MRDAYLDRLVKAGALRSESSGRFGRKRWIVPQSARADQARDRLDAIAYSTGPVDLSQAAFGGLVHAIDLDRHLYPRRTDRNVRRRLAEISSGKWTQAAADAVSSAARATAMATQASARAATDAAMQAATQAAMQASMSAAINASNTP